MRIIKSFANDANEKIYIAMLNLSIILYEYCNDFLFQIYRALKSND